jgi:hypothetical protein
VLELNPSYGYRRIALELNLGKERVRRVMKVNGMKPYKRKARWARKRDYGKPEVILVGDFTEYLINKELSILQPTWIFIQER